MEYCTKREKHLLSLVIPRLTESCPCSASGERTVPHITSLGRDQNSECGFYWMHIAFTLSKKSKTEAEWSLSWGLPVNYCPSERSRCGALAFLQTVPNVKAAVERLFPFTPICFLFCSSPECFYYFLIFFCILRFHFRCADVVLLHILPALGEHNPSQEGALFWHFMNWACVLGFLASPLGMPKSRELGLSAEFLSQQVCDATQEFTFPMGFQVKLLLLPA